MRSLRPLSPEEFRLVAQLLALSVSPPWPRFVLQVLNATGTGEGAKAAAMLWRARPEGEFVLLAAIHSRFLWRRAG